MPPNAPHRARRAHAKHHAQHPPPRPPSPACGRYAPRVTKGNATYSAGKSSLLRASLKPRRIFRISFMWLRRFTQVVAQGRRGRALQKLGEYRFRAILLKPWSGVEPIEFGVRERKEHTVGASSGGWNQRGALADT